MSQEDGNFSEEYASDSSSSSESGDESIRNNSNNNTDNESNYYSSSSEWETDDEDEMIEDLNLEWNEFTEFTPAFTPYESDPTINCPGTNNESTPYDFLKQLLTDSIIHTICQETNRYAKSHEPQFEEVSTNEIWSFLALVILTGLIKKPTLKSYWCTDPLTATPFFSTVFSRNRFDKILQYFHLANNEGADTRNRMVKFGNILTSLFKNFRKCVNPGVDLCIDESLVKFKGRLAFRIYIPSKRARFGIKVFILTDSKLNYILDAIIYTGESTKFRYSTRKFGMGAAAVLSLLKRYFNSGRTVCIDNFFSSPLLSTILLKKKIHSLGTVRITRKFMPQFSKQKQPKGHYENNFSGTMLVEKWEDRRTVHILNTFIPPQMENVENRRGKQVQKPKSVLKYNSMMGSVDSVDRQIKPYEIIRKSLKWYKKLFFWFVDIAIWNSFVLYKTSTGNKITFYEYKHKLVDLIILKHGKHIKHKGRPPLAPRTNSENIRMTGQHWPEKKPNGKYQNCCMCEMKRNNYKKLEDKCQKAGKELIWEGNIPVRRQTDVQCETCKVTLCKFPCFKDYHLAPDRNLN